MVGCCERYMEHRFGVRWMRGPCEGGHRREELTAVLTVVSEFKMLVSSEFGNIYSVVMRRLFKNEQRSD